jgi:flavin-dependent dehydrogenase
MNPSVLIVGAGPVGLALACELTRYRVPVRIVDKAPQRTDKSKALVLWSRTLELLDRGDTGAAPFVEAGFKVDGVDIVAADRRVVGHVKMESVLSPYNYALMLPQSDTERLLERDFSALASPSNAARKPRRSKSQRMASKRRSDTPMSTRRRLMRIGWAEAMARTASCATPWAPPSLAKPC